MDKAERNARRVRELQRRAENKRCAECHERGPSYVCTDFNTFVCTSCSGLLREFTYHVKSISMSTFSTDEVKRLKVGGNEVARNVWLARFEEDVDSTFRKEPDGSNRKLLKAWIKAKYGDRRWHAESARDEGVKKKVNGERQKTKSKKQVSKRELKEIIPNAPKIVVREKEEEPNLLDFDDFMTGGSAQTQQQTSIANGTEQTGDEDPHEDSFGDFSSAPVAESAEKPPETTNPLGSTTLDDPFAALSFDLGPSQAPSMPSSTAQPPVTYNTPVPPPSLDSKTFQPGVHQQPQAQVQVQSQAQFNQFYQSQGNKTQQPMVGMNVATFNGLVPQQAGMNVGQSVGQPPDQMSASTGQPNNAGNSGIEPASNPFLALSANPTSSRGETKKESEETTNPFDLF